MLQLQRNNSISLSFIVTHKGANFLEEKPLPTDLASRSKKSSSITIGINPQLNSILFIAQFDLDLFLIAKQYCLISFRGQLLQTFCLKIPIFYLNWSAVHRVISRSGLKTLYIQTPVVLWKYLQWGMQSFFMFATHLAYFGFYQSLNK